MGLLTKIVKLVDTNGNPVQVCKYKKDYLFFVKELDNWNQFKPKANRLEYSLPSDKPLVYYINSFLESNNESTQLTRIKRGVYEPL